MTDIVPRSAEFLLYESEDGRTRVEVRFEGETAWLSITQMADLFQRDKSVISRHIKNVFDEGELDAEATVAKSATVQKEGGREVTREVEYFNLDMIISVGWTGAAPRKTDVVIAKNYLGAEELDALNKIVTAYLEFAEVQALNRRPMYMADWIAKLDDSSGCPNGTSLPTPAKSRTRPRCRNPSSSTIASRPDGRRSPVRWKRTSTKPSAT